MITLDNEVVKHWTNGGRVITSKWSEKDFCLSVIVTFNDQTYSLYSFFNVGDVTSCSMDIRNKSAESFIVDLLDKVVD